MSLRSTAAVAAAVLGFALPAGAQEVPTRVALPGALRVESGGIFSIHDDAFGSLGAAENARGPLVTPFRMQLDAATFDALARLEARLGRLQRPPPEAPQEPGEPEEPEEPGEESLAHRRSDSLSLRTSALHLSVDRREIPFVLELGVLPRISLQLRVPLVQNWVEIRGLVVDGGNVGLNPDPGFNEQLVAGTDTTLFALAGGRLLPVAGTVAAQQLQDTVRVLTGSELRLPSATTGTVGLAGLDEVAGFDRGPHMPGTAGWNLGDVTVGARVQLVNTIGVTSTPRTGRGLRAVAEGGVRLATGTPVGAGFLALPPPRDGLSGYYLAGAGDAFVGPRLGVTAQGRVDRLGMVEVGRRTWVEDEESLVPIDQTITWDAGTRATFSIAPRFQLVDEISIFGRYAFARQSGESMGPGVVTSSTRTAQRWGMGGVYSTLRPGDPEGGRLPFELVFQISGTAGGSGGEPAVRQVGATLRFYPRLWGRGGRPSNGGDPIQE